MSFILSLLTLLFFTTPNSTTPPQPVKWDFNLVQTGDAYAVQATAKIQKGWYVYSSHMDNKGPIPTSFSFTKGVMKTGKINEPSQKIEGMDPLFETYVIKYKDEAVFEIPIEIEKGTKVVEGAVRFMSCDNSRCLPPDNIPFSLSLDK